MLDPSHVRLELQITPACKEFLFHVVYQSIELIKAKLPFIASWAVILILYPVLYPLLKLFNFVKKNTDSRPVVASAVKGLSMFNEIW